MKAATNSPTHLLHRAGQLADDLFSRAVGDLGITARQYVFCRWSMGLKIRAKRRCARTQASIAPHWQILCAASLGVVC